MNLPLIRYYARLVHKGYWKPDNLPPDLKEFILQEERKLFPESADTTHSEMT